MMEPYFKCQVLPQTRNTSNLALSLLSADHPSLVATSNNSCASTSSGATFLAPDCYNQQLSPSTPLDHFLSQVSSSDPVSSRLFIQPTHRTTDLSMAQQNRPGNTRRDELHRLGQNAPVTATQLNYNQRAEEAANIAFLPGDSRYLEGPIPKPVTTEAGKPQAGYDFGYSPGSATSDVYPPNYQTGVRPISPLVRVSSTPSLGYPGEREADFYSPHPIKLEHQQAALWPYQLNTLQTPHQPSPSFSTGSLTPSHSLTPSFSDLGSSIMHTPFSQGNSPTHSNLSWEGSSRNGARTPLSGPHRPPSASTVHSNHSGSVYYGPGTARSSNSSIHVLESSQCILPESEQLYNRQGDTYNLYPSIYSNAHSAGEQTRSTPHSPPHEGFLECPICGQRLHTHELLAKHSLRHQKLHRCRVANCARTEGFTTTNDRDRHEKSVHKTPGVYFRCMDENCASYTKTFARRDNLKDHLKRMHKFPAHMDEAEANERRNELADSWKVDILAVPTDNETPSLRIMS